MNFNLVDPCLKKSLEDLSANDIWEDLIAARAAEVIWLTNQPQFNEDGLVIIEDQWISEGNGCPDVRVRLYSPAKRPQNLPVLLWIHGGGFVVGSPESLDRLVVELVTTLPSVVVSVDYRLAPESPFPAPLDDCYVALKWLKKNAEALGVDARRIAIGGISAGAGLAAGLALLARDRMEIDIHFQWLLCPMIDDRNITASSYMLTDRGAWSRESNLRGWAAYLGDQAGSKNVSHYAAPSRATKLSRLPRTYIAVGSLDLFVDENIDYAQRLNQSGVPTELHVFPGGYHGFEVCAWNAPISKRARETHFSALGQAFGSFL